MQLSAQSAENRLKTMFSYSGAVPQQRISFEYDWQGRRIGKRVWDNTAGTGTPVLDEKYLYDGWNLLAELNATNNQVIRSYLWGADLSGSMQGAGGVGGLLAVNVAASTESPQPSTHFVCYDGNGNVVSLVNAEIGEHSAQYEYGPFGEVLRATGPMAKVNPFRFSTKYQDDETDLLYYGYRYYSASTGRWLSRDPIGENGGQNLFVLAGNSPINLFDILGLADASKPLPPGFNTVIPGNWPTVADGQLQNPVPVAPSPTNPRTGSPSDHPSSPRSAPAASPSDAMGVAANVLNAGLNNMEIAKGLERCRAGLASGPTGEKCCVIMLCETCGAISGRKSLTLVLSYLSQKPCSPARRDFFSHDVLKPSCSKGDQEVQRFIPMFNLGSSYVD